MNSGSTIVMISIKSLLLKQKKFVLAWIEDFHNLDLLKTG